MAKRFSIGWEDEWSDDSSQPAEDKASFYHIKVWRGWFRKKDVFFNRLYYYERQLADKRDVHMALDAGNMIYVMMRRLKSGVDWDRQDALIGSYRNLMYKMSFVDVAWYRSDMGYFHIQGQKNDIMWAVSFLTQVYPEDVMECHIVTTDHYGEETVNNSFSVQNGVYVGEGAAEAQLLNDALPDIWAVDPHTIQAQVAQTSWMEYSPLHQPDTNEKFALPDGRVGIYVRMNERFEMAEYYKEKIGPMERHAISSSLIKDFEDLVRSQTSIEYDMYQMRYVAFMSKVHELEHLMKGLEVTVYDSLPVAERGLPCAPKDTIQRTNAMDFGSIRYLIDRVRRNKGHLTSAERKKLMTEAGRSIIARVRGYDVEYQMYQATGTPEDLCKVLHDDKCRQLYLDVAELESVGELDFPVSVYRVLCNDPAGSSYSMTDFEKLKIRVFGRGYADFIAYQAKHAPHTMVRNHCKKAYLRLRKWYLNKK